MPTTLRAVGDFITAVPRAAPVTWRTRVLEFLQSRPDIDSAGEHRDGIWAITQDGVPLAPWNNRTFESGGLTEPERYAAPTGTETPGKTPAKFSVTVGAEMVPGWTEDVNARSVMTATPFVFDRLLGTNQVLPPARLQRPFDYENVWTERHPGNGTAGAGQFRRSADLQNTHRRGAARRLVV